MDQVQHHAVKRGVERRDVVGDQAVAARRQRPGEADGERVGAAFEVGEGERPRLARLRMVEPARDMPAPGLGTQGALGRRGGGRERFDADAVGGAADELLLEIGTLQDLVDR